MSFGISFHLGCARGFKGNSLAMRVFYLTLRHFDLIVMLRHARARIIRERAVSGKFLGRSFARICVIRERKIFLIHTRMWVHYQRADRFEKFFCRPAVMTSETAPEPPPTPDHTPRPEPIPDRKRQTVRPSAHAARLDRMA